MTQISEPNTTLSIISANVPVENASQNAILLAQMTAAGTATADALYQNVSPANISGLGGVGSQAESGYDAFKLINPNTPLDVIFLDDPTGSAAVGTCTWAGTATAAGTITIGIGDERNGIATVAVSIGDDDTVVATAVTAAYSTLLKCLCAVTTNAIPEQNDFTARNDGTEGNFIPLYIDSNIAGITYALVGMTGGTGVPVVTTSLSVVGQKRENVVIQPGTYGTANLVAFLDPRWNVTNRIQDGVGIVSVVADAATSTTALDLLNSQNLVYNCINAESHAEYKGGDKFESPLGQSCMFGALKTLRLSSGSNISAYVNASGGALDSTGGPSIASLPYFNSPLPMPAMNAAYGYTDTELEAIKTAGGFVIGNNTAGNQIIVGEVPTTYKTDSAGNADISFKYLNYVDTMSQAREFMFNNFKADCAQSRLTEGGLIANRNINNEASINAKAIRYFQILGGPDYVLAQNGEDARVYFIGNLTVTLNLSTGLVTVTMKLPIVTQLRTINGTVQVVFSVTE